MQFSDQQLRAALDLLGQVREDVLNELQQQYATGELAQIGVMLKAVLRVDPDGLWWIVEANDEMVAFAGCTEGEIVGHRVRELVGHEQPSYWAWQVLRGERPEAFSVGWLVHRPTGEQRWFFQHWTRVDEHTLQVEAWPTSAPQAGRFQVRAMKSDQDHYADVIVDAARIIREVLPGFTRDYGWRPDQLLGHEMRYLRGGEGETERPVESILFERTILQPLQRGEFDTSERKGEVPFSGAWIFNVNLLKVPSNGIITHLGKGWLHFRFTRLA